VAGGVSVINFDIQLASAQGQHTTVALAGEFDVYAAVRLRQWIADLLVQPRGPTSITLDLADVDFIDSSAIGLLVGTTKRLRAMGGDLVIRQCGYRVRRVIDLVELGDFLTIETEAEHPNAPH
jgi:anti-sigma B factor antagonist